MSIDLLHGVALVYPQIRAWRGAVAVDEETDLKALQGLKPPKAVVTTGMKRLVKAERLVAFEAFRKRVERRCKRDGFAFMGGYCQPEARVDELHHDLDAFAQEFPDLRRAFLSNIDDYYDEMEREHPNWAHILRPARLSAADLGNRFAFSYTIAKLAPPAADAASPLNVGLANAANSMLPALLQEVAASARELWVKSIRGKVRLLQSTLKPVQQLVDKLHGFCFLDRRVEPIVDGFLASLASFPRLGPIEGSPALIVGGMVQLMADPQLLLDHGGALLSAADDPAIPATPDEMPDAPQGPPITPTLRPTQLPLAVGF